MRILDFFHNLSKLKNVNRTGWIKRNIKNPESVADHSYSLAVLAIILAPKFRIDQCRAVKMALIHDIGESKIGDIITRGVGYDLPNLSSKLAAEKNAVEAVSQLIDGNEINELYREFQEQDTPEAKFVRELDGLDMALQAFEYEQQQQVQVQDIYDDIQTRIKDPVFIEIFQQMLKIRNEKV